MNTVYELGYLLVPTLADKEVADTKTALEQAITNTGAEHKSSGDVYFIDLAYEMVKKVKSSNVKFDQAHFGWIKFTSDDPQAIDKAVKAMDAVLRHIVVKTVEDDSLTDLFSAEEVTETEESSNDQEEGGDEGDDAQDDSGETSDKEEA